MKLEPYWTVNAVVLKLCCTANTHSWSLSALLAVRSSKSDPDPAFDFDADMDPDPAFQNEADPDSQHCVPHCKCLQICSVLYNRNYTLVPG